MGNFAADSDYRGTRRAVSDDSFESVFRTRGVLGGWRDVWDGPDDHAELRARAEAVEHRHTRHAAVLDVVWQGEIRAERRERRRQQP